MPLGVHGEVSSRWVSVPERHRHCRWRLSYARDEMKKLALDEMVKRIGIIEFPNLYRKFTPKGVRIKEYLYSRVSAFWLLEHVQVLEHVQGLMFSPVPNSFSNTCCKYSPSRVWVLEGGELTEGAIVSETIGK